MHRFDFPAGLGGYNVSQSKCTGSIFRRAGERREDGERAQVGYLYKLSQSECTGTRERARLDDTRVHGIRLHVYLITIHTGTGEQGHTVTRAHGHGFIFENMSEFR